METDRSRPSVTLGGLSITVGASAIFCALGLWLALSLVGVFLLNFSPIKAVILALAATALHWLSEFLHQLGHATAARSTGYPMVGIHFWGLLSSSRYPADEPVLPRSVHIRRALGG